MENAHISTEKAKQDKLFYVVANLIIVNSVDRTCLILKRSETEPVFPGKWAFPGGKLEHKDLAGLLKESGRNPQDGVDNILGNLAVREAKEECGLDVDANSLRLIKNNAFVRPDGVPVFMTVLATEYTGGEVVFEAGAFTDSAWVTLDELRTYDCIEGMHEEAKQALAE